MHTAVSTLRSVIKMSSVVYRLVHPPVTRESGVRLPAEELFALMGVSVCRLHEVDLKQTAAQLTSLESAARNQVCRRKDRYMREARSAVHFSVQRPPKRMH